MLLSPQAEKNWEGLCSVLEDVLEDQSHRKLFGVELGSGTGQHVIRFAQKMPFVTWQPSDINEESLNRFVSFTVSNTFYTGFIFSSYVDMKKQCLIFKYQFALTAYILTVSRHTLLQPMQRMCRSLHTWMPVSRGSNGQAFIAAPVMLLLPLTYCNTAPSKQHR